MCKHGVIIGLSIGVNIGVNMQIEHFVCIILWEFFILTLLCLTYIFLHFVCITLCVNVGVNIGVNMQKLEL